MNLFELALDNQTWLWPTGFDVRGLVALDHTVGSAVQTIRDHVHRVNDNVSYRKPPLMISSMGRSGKTTTLHCIFDRRRNGPIVYLIQWRV